MPFPLSLLPVVGEDITAMESAVGLQNKFMKNTLIRGLNNVYANAGVVKDSRHKDFKAFMRYNQIVCNMIRTHCKGDEVFFTSLTPSKATLDSILGGVWSKNEYRAKLQNALDAWSVKIQEWSSKPRAYRGVDLLTLSEGIELPFVKGLLDMSHCLKHEALAPKFSQHQMQDMIHDAILWLATKGDLPTLLPYCASHHDRETSTFWPVITPEGLAALPGLVEKDPSIWALAPYDPLVVVKSSKN